MANREGLIQQINEILPSLPERDLEFIFRVARGSHLVELKRQSEKRHQEAMREIERVRAGDIKLQSDFREDLREGPQGVIQAIDRLDRAQQGTSEEYDRALYIALLAALAPEPDGSKYLDFARYLVNQRGYHNYDYFSDTIHQGDFQEAAILAPNITNEELQNTLEGILEIQQEEYLSEGEQVPESSRAEEAFIRDLLAGRGDQCVKIFGP